MENDEIFVKLFEEVKPIIFKQMKQLRVSAWEYEDYFQEGMITLYELLQKLENLEKIHLKFKVQYHQRLIDEIRHSRAKKRGFDRFDGLDIYECSDWIASTEETPEGELVFNHLLSEVYEKLTPHYQELLLRQMRGEELTRMERYRLREKIKSILFDDED